MPSQKACLKYHIGRCSGPCIGAISQPDYINMIKNIISFLDGKQENITKNLKTKMDFYSDNQDYEKAAIIRDRINAIKDVINSQKISLSLTGDKDAIAFTQKDNIAYAEIFFIRNGKVLGHNNLVIEGVKEEEPEKIMAEILKQYYLIAAMVPPQIILQYSPKDKKIISDWLRHIRGGIVKLITPSKGKNRQLIEIVEQNAIKGMEFHQLIKYTEVDYSLLAEEIKNRLKLNNTPYRIEGYDISDISGDSAVGCLVSFEKGKPRKDLYRKFKIRLINGIDDYSMMKQILKRRFDRYLAGEEKWSTIPDLILIDGGKGHLNVATETLQSLNISNIDVISIAKEQEQVFTPGRSAPIILDYSSATLHLLQRIRDEVHRYAISYHKNIREKKMKRSILDDIPGIGNMRKAALLKAFGSVAKIKNAEIDDLVGIAGINRELAKTIIHQLN
jgi:excinuclease ABC subunit C